MVGMIVKLVWLAGMRMHGAHQEEMRQGTKQHQPHNNHGADGDLQEQDGCQSQNREQTAKQQDPDMTPVHSCPPLSIPCERRSGDK